MRNKGIGLKNKVIQMLEAMPAGKYHFLIAKIIPRICNFTNTLCHTLQIRRLSYFQHILQQRKDSSLHKFFMAQLSYPTHKDWVSHVLKELDDLDIKFEIEQVPSLSKEKYNESIKEAVYRKAFSDLLQRKQSRQSELAKGKLIKYSENQLPEYLCPKNKDLTIEEQKWLFKCRVDDVYVKGNIEIFLASPVKRTLMKLKITYFFVNIY